MINVTLRRLVLLALLVTASSAHGDEVPSARHDALRPDETLAFAYTAGIPGDAYTGIQYDEPCRPQFHFSSARNWINDPNGLVHDGKLYHMFFQHNPLAPVWGNMTWGHATSTDLIHWTQHSHALLPYRVDGQSGAIFSGSAVVDHNNSLGVQEGDVPTLCACFTFATSPAFYQALAYSTDRGETWKYWNDGRAVVINQGFDSGERDPKVFWHEPSQQWVMVLWVQQNPGRVRIFVSQNLHEWTLASELLRDWAFECMDVVFLPLDGDKNQTKAVIYDASFDYEVGQFDGREFHTQAGPFVAGGGNFYAAQTFNNSPDGRVIQVGWMRGGPNWAEAYGLPSNLQMSFPCELTLRTVDGKPRLYAWPIAEIETLSADSEAQTDLAIADRHEFKGQSDIDLADVSIDFAPGDAQTISLRVGAAQFTYDAASSSLRLAGVNDQGQPTEVTVFEHLAPRDGVISLRMLVDRLSVETFAFGGEQFHADYVRPDHDRRPVTIGPQGGDITVQSLRVQHLKSAWPATAK